MRAATRRRRPSASLVKSSASDGLAPRPLWRAALRLCIAAAAATAVEAGHQEIHAGYRAVHVTPLRHRVVQLDEAKSGVWRREAGASSNDEPSRSRGRQLGVPSNMITELQDRTSEYTGEIGVGTRADGSALYYPRVVFDTGSTNLWVASVLCQSGPCVNDKQVEYYDPAKSLTQEKYDDHGPGDDIDIMFGTGELKGPLHMDTYRVGPMVVKQQPFAMIREMTGEVFSSFPFEGILGLAFPSLSFGGITPFFERVIEQKVVKNNEFAFYFNVDVGQPSALLWGGVDKQLYEGPITMFPVVQMHYWSLELVEFRVGDRIIGGTRHPDSGLKRLIIDSGTTYFTVPSELYVETVRDVGEAPCDDVLSYPPLTYVLRGVHGETFDVVVTQETYMIATLSDDRTCKPAVMTLDVNQKYGPAAILGEVFMRHFFTVFSRGDGSPDQARVGIAASKIGAKPLPKKNSSGEITAEPTEGGDDEAVLAVRGPSDQRKQRQRALLRSLLGNYVEHPQRTPRASSSSSFLETPRNARRFVEPPLPSDTAKAAPSPTKITAVGTQSRSSAKAVPVVAGLAEQELSSVAIAEELSSDIIELYPGSRFARTLRALANQSNLAITKPHHKGGHALVRKESKT